MNSGFTGQETGELSVDEDEIVGIIKEDTEDHMCWVSVLNITSSVRDWLFSSITSVEGTQNRGRERSKVA